MSQMDSTGKGGARHRRSWEIGGAAALEFARSGV